MSYDTTSEWFVMWWRHMLMYYLIINSDNSVCIGNMLHTVHVPVMWSCDCWLIANSHCSLLPTYNMHTVQLCTWPRKCGAMSHPLRSSLICCRAVIFHHINCHVLWQYAMPRLHACLQPEHVADRCLDSSPRLDTYCGTCWRHAHTDVPAETLGKMGTSATPTFVD